MVPNSQNNQFDKHDLGLSPMTLVLKRDLDIVKMCLHTKNEVSIARHSKVIAQTDRQTHSRTQTHIQTDSMKTFTSGSNNKYCFQFLSITNSNVQEDINCTGQVIDNTRQRLCVLVIITADYHVLALSTH